MSSNMQHMCLMGDLEMHTTDQGRVPGRKWDFFVYKIWDRFSHEPTLLPSYAGSAILISSFSSFFSQHVSVWGAKAALMLPIFASPLAVSSTAPTSGVLGQAMFLATSLPTPQLHPALCSINTFQVSALPDDVVLKQSTVNIFKFFHEYFESCPSYPRQFWTNFEARFYKTLHQMFEHLLFVIYFAKCLKCIYRRQASALM